MLAPMTRLDVVVVGSINVDLIVSTARLPGPGETVLGGRFIEQDGGKGANQAAAAARVGASVAMVGAVGGDDLGERALASLAACGVDVSTCARLEGERTGYRPHRRGCVRREPDRRGLGRQCAARRGAWSRMPCSTSTRLRAPSAWPASRSATRPSWPRRAGLRDEACASSSILLRRGPSRPTRSVRRRSSRPTRSRPACCPVSADPGAAARWLAERSGAPVIVSLGADGVLLQRDGRAERLPVTPVLPVDTTGAGDALNGILAAELARGAELREALRWAMAGAALQVTQPGARAGLPTREAIAARAGPPRRLTRVRPPGLAFGSASRSHSVRI